MVREGVTPSSAARSTSTTGGRRYFNTTPLGRAVTALAIVRAMRKTASTSSVTARPTRATTSSGSTATASSPTPQLTIYKPWLDPKFVDELGGRKEMAEYLERIGLPYQDGREKAYSTDANVLGATHEAKDLEFLDRRTCASSSPSWAWRSGSADVAIEPER
jgi:argininosuccinate synthase